MFETWLTLCIVFLGKKLNSYGVSLHEDFKWVTSKGLKTSIVYVDYL